MSVRPWTVIVVAMTFARRLGGSIGFVGRPGSGEWSVIALKLALEFIVARDVRDAHMRCSVQRMLHFYLIIHLKFCMFMQVQVPGSRQQEVRMLRLRVVVCGVNKGCDVIGGGLLHVYQIFGRRTKDIRAARLVRNSDVKTKESVA